MQRRRKTTTSVLDRNSSLRARSPRANAVRLASNAVVENLETRQLLSTSIGINFTGGRPTPTYPMAPADTAGVIPQANWNNAAGNTGTITAPLDSTGSAVATAGTTVTYTGGTIYAAAGAAVIPTAGDQTLNDGFLAGGSGSDVMITGIPYTNYDVYIYELNDAQGRIEATYNVNTGQLVTGAAANPTDANHIPLGTGTGGVPNTYLYTQSTGTDNSSATPGGDYVLFANQTGGTFEFKATAPGGSYVNGFEIVQSAATTLGAPSLFFTPAPSANNADLVFSATNATSYDITRTNGDGSGFVDLTPGGQVGTNFTDSTALGGSSYKYTVIASAPAQANTSITGGVFVPGATLGDGWSAAFYTNQGGGSTNGSALDPLGDSLAGKNAVPLQTKIDPKIDFTGGTNASMDGFADFNNGNNQSIRFDGYLQAPASGAMTFWTSSDDGIQASINEGTDASPNWVTVTQRMRDARGQAGAGFFNEWSEVNTVTAPNSNDTFNSGSAFQFKAGQLYHVVVAVQNGGGGWGGHLGWSGPAALNPGALNGTIVPQSNVFVIAPSAPANVLATPIAGGGNQITWDDGMTPGPTGPGSAAESYLVESSPDGNTWTTVGTQSAASHPNPIQYSITDFTGTSTTQYRVTAITSKGSSAPETAGSLNATLPATGDGWSAAFFHDQGAGAFSGASGGPIEDVVAGNPGVAINTKIDSIINFSGGQNNTEDGFPGFNNGANQSIRFDGYLKAPASGTMTFWTTSDDGNSVAINEGTDAAPNWVDVISGLRLARGTTNPWSEHSEVDTVTAGPNTSGTNPLPATAFNTGTAFNFVAGQLYHIAYMQQNGGGGWGGKLGWSGPAAAADGSLTGVTVGVVIPQTAIYAIAPTEPVTISTASGGGVVVVSWNEGNGSEIGATGAATGFTVLRSTNGGAFTAIGNVTAGGTPAGNTSNPSTYSFTDTTGSFGVNYAYRVVATTGYATSSPLTMIGTVQFLPVLAVPTQITAVRSAVPTTINVSWTGVTGATGYVVQRATSIDANGHLVSPTTVTPAGGAPGTTFADTTAAATTDYYYTVQAVTTNIAISSSAVSYAVFVGHGDGWDATWYGYRDGNNSFSEDAANAVIGFSRVETGPIAYGANSSANGDNVGPPNYPLQWIAQGPNQVLANPNTGVGDNMAARWVSWVEAPVTGYYTFGGASDDGNSMTVYDSTGVPVVVGGLEIGRGVPGTPDPGVVKDHLGNQYLFTAGHKYLVQYEFSNGGGGWGANLYWSASSTPTGGSDLMNQQLVPADDAVVPTPAFITLDGNNPVAPGLVKDQPFYTLKGAVASGIIEIDWNNIGADSYNVYYHDNTADPNNLGTITKATATPITATAGAPLSYQISGLTNGDSYTVWVTGITQSGETTPPSITPNVVVGMPGTLNQGNGSSVTVTVNDSAPATATVPIVVFDQWNSQNADQNPANNSLVLGTADTARLLVYWTPIPFATSYIVTPFKGGVAQPTFVVTGATQTFFAGAFDQAWTFTVQGMNASTVNLGNGPGLSPVSVVSNSVTVPTAGNVVEGYFQNTWWYANGFTNPGYNDVGTPDNLTAQPGPLFNAGGGAGQPNEGSTTADRAGGRVGQGGIGENYSVVYEGTLTAPFTGNYTFNIQNDDLGALIIDGNLVIAETGCCGPTANANPIHYNAGDKISVIYMFQQTGGGHDSHLLWQYASDDGLNIQATNVDVPAADFNLIDSAPGVGPNGLPLAPSNVAGTQDAVGSSKIDFTFTDNAVNELHYSLLRSTNVNMTGAITVATSNFVGGTGNTGQIFDTSGTNVSGVTYYYEVVAVNLYGTAASTPAIPISNVFVNAPTGFSANPGNNLETVLQWVNAPVSGGTSIIIEFSTDQGATWNPLAGSPIAENGPGLHQVFRISGGTAGVETMYRITATDGVNNSPTSNPQGVLPVALPGPDPSLVDYSAGFTPNTLVVNSSGSDVGVTTVLPSGALQLTNNNFNEARSAWQTAQVPDNMFTTTFDYTANAGTNLADGMLFVLQNDPTGTAALGGGGGGKGAQGLAKMIGLGLNPYSGVSQGVLFLNGAQIAAVDLTTVPGSMPAIPTGIDLHSGDTFEVVITYDSSQNLSVTVTDVTSTANPAPTVTITAASIQGAIDTALAVPLTTPVNIPGITGSSKAYAGFSGGTGGVAEEQTISNWTYGAVPITPAPPMFVTTQIDDGNRQKSEIRSLTFKFTSAVQQLTAGSVTLARSNALGSRSGTNDGSPDTDVSAALNFAGATTTDGGLSWTIPFNKSVAGITDASGSLVDDVYSSTVHATLVMDAFGQTLVGGDQVKVFHRLYGDVNNVKKLNNAEFTQFSNTFGLAGGVAGYNRYFDFKGPTLAAPMGSVINNADFTQFSNRFPPAFLGFVYTASGL